MSNQNRLGLLLDVETTGLSPYKDEIIELACILFSYRHDTGEIFEVVSQDSFLREPLSESAKQNYQSAFRIHGIPYQMVKGKTFNDIKIQDYFQQSNSIFAHNASFDRSFLNRLYPESNELNWYCTMRNIPWKQYGYSNSKLITLLSAHHITKHQTHRAMDDITYLLELLKQHTPAGYPYLRDAISKKPMQKYASTYQQQSRKKYLRNIQDESKAGKESS
ncbi:DNA polymerase III subunit epsilon [Bacillaceae bacterium Marseille-Q3522]|nr:DNA polymerase III subunit epsilon [Bacillaceae bacterium Marseille-Q3522]